MEINPVRDADEAALVRLYAGNHRSAPRQLRLRPDQQAQTFVARVDDRIMGFATVSYFDDGTQRYGILHVLEVDNPQADYAIDTASALAQACRTWRTSHICENSSSNLVTPVRSLADVSGNSSLLKGRPARATSRHPTRGFTQLA